MAMKIRSTAMIALSVTLISFGGMAFAADILKPATPSLTATAPAEPAPVAAPATTPPATGTATQATPTSTSASAAPAFSSAQPGDGLKLSTQSTGPAAIAPKDIPDVLMAEMKEIESSCEKNYFYSSFHDCKCISVKFLDARMKSDPNTSKDRVFNSVAGQCVNEPAIAGYIYKSCGDYMQHVRKDYVDFCKCSANKVAETYTKAPIMSLRYIEGLRRNAFVECGIRDKVDKPETTPKKFQ